jgi:hypothetical protein
MLFASTMGRGVLNWVGHMYRTPCPVLCVSAGEESGHVAQVGLCCVSLCCVVLQVRIDKFNIEVDPQQLPGGTHYYLVKGEAVERFAQVCTGCVCGLQHHGNPHCVCSTTSRALKEYLQQSHVCRITLSAVRNSMRCTSVCCLRVSADPCCIFTE